MRCKLCDRWRARQWEKSDAWERAHSNESELWSEEPLRNRELIQQAYEKAGRVKTETARLLGIKTSALYYKLEKYGFISKEERPPDEG